MSQYELKAGSLKIQDDELGIDLCEPFDLLKFCMKKEQTMQGAYHLFCSLDGQLHGPSFFYDVGGKLLSSSWFYQGMRLGKVRQYYSSGGLYASLGFKGGKREGEHQYYFPDGKLRTIMHYVKGSLDKEMILFWPSGQRKRHLHFQCGRKYGTEKFWDERGCLVKEISHRPLEQGVSC